MLVVDNISLKAGNFELQDVSFHVERGDYFVILGMSGVGKSLLLESIAGLLEIDGGEIYLRGKKITGEKIQRRNISIVYQDADLFPHLTVYENIAYPLHCRKEKNIKEKVLYAAEQTGIMDKIERFPGTLSGGEYQRAALARSLAAGNDLFLLDEPLSSLDPKSKAGLRSLLRKLNRKGITIVHVTHDYEEAVSLSSKIGIMENGRLVDSGTPEEIFRHPKSEFVARFVGVKNFLHGVLVSNPNSELKEFITGELKILSLTDVEDGEAFLMILPQEINISNEKETGSSRNSFPGRIMDISPARIGIELTVDAGAEFIVTVSKEALQSLKLAIGTPVWISFKASACKIYK